MATKGKKKATRATSNVFAMFEQSQVQEFKEVEIFFNLSGGGVGGRGRGINCLEKKGEFFSRF